MNNVHREHIVEVKEKEKEQTTSNCLKGKNRCKILEGQTIFEMEIILFMQLAQSFSSGKTVLIIIICLKGF